MAKIMGIKVLGSIVVVLFGMGLLCKYQPIAKDIEDAGPIATASFTGAVLLCLVTTAVIIGSSDP